MNHADREYLALCRHLLKHGTRKEDRTGTGTLSGFGYQMRFNLAEGFPLLTTKRVPFRLIAEELLWFLRGETDVKDLVDRNVHIWNADAYRVFKERGETETYDEFVELLKGDDGYFDLGPIYGKQWRSWQIADVEFTEVFDDMELTSETIDQIANVIESIQTNPHSRRHMVSAWNPGDLDEMALPPCHVLFQFYVADGKLSCQLYQRSGDMFLGIPFNIASYALLTHIIAHICDLEVGEFIHTLGDAHIYTNHIEQVQEQLTREPRALPQLSIKRTVNDPADYDFQDFVLTGYDPHPSIKGTVSVGL